MQHFKNEECDEHNYNNYECSFNKLNIQNIKDYDELDIQIIKNLIKLKEDHNLIDILLDNIEYDILSENDYNCLLNDISNQNIHNIIKYMNRTKNI